MTADPAETAALPTQTTLYFGPWYRRSPMFESTLRAGCSAYDVYNHMYLPAYYDDPVTEYWALLNGVTVWDVGVERVVQIAGPDAFELTNMMTCRDLTKCAVGQGKYALITAPDGGIVNDPVLLRRAEDSFWLCLADSDVHLYALGLAHGLGLDVEVSLPDAHAVQVQGPHAKDVLRELVGDEVLDVRYYWTLDAKVDGIPVVISRTGWTGEIGYELYLTDHTRGADLWDAIMSAGGRYDIRPIAPCEPRRIEAGIFNYNSDMTLADNPFMVMGLERLVEEQEADYIGKAALERIRHEGVPRRLVGIEMPGEPLAIEITEERPAFRDGQRVGRVTDLVWSPRLERNIGYVWVPTELSAPGTPLQVELKDGRVADAATAAIPFIDPGKAVPAA
jgi:aminomethyltransferase